MGIKCPIMIGGINLRFATISRSQRSIPFSHQTVAAAKQLPPRLKLNEEDVREAFVHGTGPGGQKINKTACAVQLKHLPTGIVIRCQETRSRSQNRRTAWRSLAEKVEALEKGPESRTAIKTAVKSRKKASKSKKARRKYRALEQDSEDGDHDEEAGDGARKEENTEMIREKSEEVHRV